MQYIRLKLASTTHIVQKLGSIGLVAYFFLTGILLTILVQLNDIFPIKTLINKASIQTRGVTNLILLFAIFGMSAYFIISETFG